MQTVPILCSPWRVRNESTVSESMADRGPEQQVGLRWLDKTTVRSLVVDVNDGIIATAGIVEGFIGAGAPEFTITVAAFSAMVAGGISLGGAKYAEAATERDAELTLIEEERLQLTMSPEEERAELAALYELKGLSTDLAQQVAAELTAKDALAAHIEAEHSLTLSETGRAPVVIAMSAGLAFAVGSGVPLLAVLLAPDAWRAAVTFVAVIACLTATSLIVARSGGTPVARTLARTLVIGATAMLLTLIGGAVIRP